MSQEARANQSLIKKKRTVKSSKKVGQAQPAPEEVEDLETFQDAQQTVAEEVDEGQPRERGEAIPVEEGVRLKFILLPCTVANYLIYHFRFIHHLREQKKCNLCLKEKWQHRLQLHLKLLRKDQK